MVVIRADLEPALRWKVLALAAAFTAAGASLIWLGLSGLLPSVRALGRRASLVVIEPIDLTILPLAVPMFAFAASCLIPVPRDEKRRRKPDPAIARRDRLTLWLLGVAAVGTSLALLASPIARMVALVEMPKRGYALCPDTNPYERRPPLRWHLPSGKCP